MVVHLRAIPVILVLGIMLFHAGNASGQHIMGRRLDVRDRPVSSPVISQIAMHTYPEAFDTSNIRHAWGALGGSDGGNVLNDTTVECPGGDCIDISTINYIMSEAPCIWPVKPYYAVVGICWNATNRGLFFTGKTVHNVKHYNVVEWWFGTYGLDDKSLCLTDTCRRGRELYGWRKCLEAVNKNYPWQGKGASLMAAPNSRVRLYNKYYGPTAGGPRDENTWMRYLDELVELQINEKLPYLTSDKRNRMHDIQKNMQKNRFGLTSQDHLQYRKSVEDSLNNALDQCKQILTDDEFRKFFGAEKRESFTLPLEAGYR